MKRKLKSAGRFSPAFLCHQLSLHPAVKISVFVVMAVLIPHFNAHHLLWLGLILGLVIIRLRISRFFVMMRRMRWLFVSMLIIYAYTTPGQYLANWPIAIAPSYEGISEGLSQITRICLVLAGVAILIASSTREALMAGIYCLIKPFEMFNLPSARFTARLYLTLQYIEQAQGQLAQGNPSSKWQQIRNLQLDRSEFSASNETIKLDMPKLIWLDWICIALLFLMVGLYR